jgi:hypothetical protein
MATVTVPVAAAVIDAVNDTCSTNGFVGNPLVNTNPNGAGADT